jgi:carbonic anhydrase
MAFFHARINPLDIENSLSIFNRRVAGNVENFDFLGSMEFACKLSGAKVTLVIGHTRCGAIKGAIDNAERGNLIRSGRHSPMARWRRAASATHQVKESRPLCQQMALLGSSACRERRLLTGSQADSVKLSKPRF